MFNYITLFLALIGFPLNNYRAEVFDYSSPIIAQTTISKNPQNLVKEIYERREQLKLCDGDINPEIALSGSSVYPLVQNKYLIQFICFLGAYQGTYHYILAEGDNLKILNFALIENKKRTVTNTIVGLPTFNPKTKNITVFNRYRGLGDCGSWAKYDWRGNQFQLLEYREKKKCDGKYIEPEKYPKVYP